MTSTAMKNRVPNAPFRARFEYLKAQQGVSAADVAAWLGWYCSKNGKPDGSRVDRLLGVRPWPGGANSSKHIAKTLSYERAVEMCEALGLDPYECGV